MKHPSRLASLAVLPLALAACFGPGGRGRPVTMADSFDLDLFGPHADDLHSPYVAGARFDISVVAHDGARTYGWTVQSSNPAVVSVSQPTAESASAFSVTATAAHAGTAELTVVDQDGNVVDSHDIRVGVPDSVGLYAYGLLLAGESDDQAHVTSARVVDGGVATFLVRYFENGAELMGGGALTPVASGAVTATSTETSFGQRRDWLAVAASGMGGGQVSLDVAGSTVAIVPVAAVDASAIKRVELAKQDDSGARDGQSLAVFARALDAAGNDAYGASFQWSLDFAPVAPGLWNFGLASDPSDVLLYRYQAGALQQLDASLDGLQAESSVHARSGSAMVSSSESVGCAVAANPGAGRGSALAMAFGLIGLAVAAVRRRRTSR